MNLVFAGTPDFALPTLQSLHAAGHELLAVYTQPDRPAGRGRQLLASPIKRYALEHHLPVHQPATLKGLEEALSLAALLPDVMIVVAYGLLLPQTILDIPTYGCLNVHASLLPRWRGAAPIQRALEAGDEKTGITIMQMQAGLDTGPSLLQREIPILEQDTSASLHERLAKLGADCLLETLAGIEADTLTPQAQDNARSCYAPKLQKDEAWIDWQQPARSLHQKIRALNPWPVAATRWQNKVLRIWDVGPLVDSHTQPTPETRPGTVLSTRDGHIHVQTGAGILDLQRLQREAGRPLSAKEFLNGQALAPGSVLGT